MPRQTTPHASGWPALLAMTLPAILFTGCVDGAWDWSGWFPKGQKSTVETIVPENALTNSFAYQGTVAEYAYFEGLRKLRIRGYGIVVGLGRNGSRTCPTAIADQLKQEMYKTRKFAERRGQHITPERLLDDPDTAVVAVEGEIPAAALKGSRFDIAVRAIPGTETTSLEGGLLYECFLQVFRPVGAAGWIPGREVAVGGGPVFLNPFGAGEGAATQTNWREGVVVGGGRTSEDRRVRLLLTVPSYQMAIRIADAINDRFSLGGTDVADAVSPGEIKLTIPSPYAHDPKHFLAVVQHVYPTLPAEMLAQRTLELAREFEAADAPHAEIALAWEAIGRPSLPEVQKFYAHPRPVTSFHAAAAGLLLGDDSAADVIEQHVLNDRSEHRLKAIRVLASAVDSMRAARPLRQALDDSDPRIRTAAYEALRERGDPTIVSVEVGTESFTLDMVPSRGEPLIYVKRTEDRRIALFGGPILVRPPAFYASPEETLIVNAAAGDAEVTLLRKSRTGGSVSPPIPGELDVSRLIAMLGNDVPQSPGETIHGLGVDYGGITRMLAELCAAQSINAQFILETPGAADELLLGRPPGRRESDL
ncbi:MAG: hypothetical protein HOP29_18325 [Phycisphaerales bacterium]|nr:hypothetical protein [Phycisphaerales bacterium]